MFNRDFTDMLAALSEEGVEYLVVGAYAVIAHGALRTTGDLDILVRRSPENAERLWRALKRFGAPLLDVSREDFIQPDVIYQIGVRPGRIDLLTEIPGVEFEQAWPNRTHVEIEGRPIPFIGREDLIRGKIASGRHKDLADVEVLRELSEADTGKEE